MFKDFSCIGDQESYVSVPEGVYRCKVADVRPGSSRDGSERWSLRLEVCEGTHAGRTAAWDSITWSERGIYRVKQVLEALGFDASGELEVEIEELLGHHAHVEVQQEEWEDPVSGRRTTRMIVPYMGFSPAPAREHLAASESQEAGSGAQASAMLPVAGGAAGGVVMEREEELDGGDDESPF